VLLSELVLLSGLVLRFWLHFAVVALSLLFGLRCFSQLVRELVDEVVAQAFRGTLSCAQGLRDEGRMRRSWALRTAVACRSLLMKPWGWPMVALDQLILWACLDLR
jgi:hypothetical protein